MPIRVWFSLLLCAAVLVITLPGLARAQDETRAEIAVQNQILELRQDVESLRAQVAAGGGAGSAAPALAPPQPDGQPQGAPVGDSTAQLLDRVSRLEDENRSLRGAVDEVRNGLQQQNADLSKQIADLTFRVQTLEDGATAAGAAAPEGGTLAAPAKPAPPVIVPPPAPKTVGLQAGYAALARRDYPGAESAARAGLHGTHAYDAQFLLAQSLAGQRNYQQAALAYDDAYTKQRGGAHAPDSLLGLANALAALGDKPAACATLNKLRGEFPAQRPDVKAGAGAVARRAACK